MTKLSVNINKFATLRNARGGNLPDVLQVARDCEKFGAQGITVHPRPDERHIRYDDVCALRPLVKTELNVEGYPSPDFLKLIEEVKPDQVTLVPDPPDVLTSNAGWDTLRHKDFLADVIAQIHSWGGRSSLFIETDQNMIVAAAELGSRRIELYTESYAQIFEQDPEAAVQPYVQAADFAHAQGLEINAGHDLNLKNLSFFQSRVHNLQEVSIGHALVCDALYFGLEQTIQLYLGALNSSI